MDPEYKLPAGFSPPLAMITTNDHAAWIYIAAILGICCFLFFGAVRILVRSMIAGGFGADDYIFYAAMGVGIIQSSIIMGACSKGLGRTFEFVSPEAQIEVQRMYYTSNLFFLAAIGLSKMSVIAFLHRISRMKSHRIVFNVATGIVAVWMVGSMVAMAFQCDLPQPWISAGAQCTGIAHRWLVINALDIASEVALIGLVVYLVYALQTPISSKLMVVYIFSYRFLLILFIGYRMSTFDAAAYTTDPFLRNVPFIAWTQAELAASLITATIPTFRNFLKSLSTGFGGIGPSSTDGYVYGYGSEGRTRMRRPGRDVGSSYQMSKLQSATRSTNAPEPGEANERTFAPQINPNQIDPLTGRSGGSEATAQWNAAGSSSDAGNNNETASIGSDESRRMIIRKDVNWTVKSEPRVPR